MRFHVVVIKSLASIEVQYPLGYSRSCFFKPARLSLSLGTFFGSQLIFSHLALLASHVLAHLGAAWPFIAAGESTVLLREASLCAATHILLSARVIELLLLAWQGIVLTHVHGLWRVCHLAVLLLVAGELVWVYH